MRVFIGFFILLVSNVLFAQDTLPRLTVVSISNHVLISWTNPYFSLTTINIQRSFDSIKNFRTIGTILDVKNKINGFADNKPPYNKMFYRVFISFEGGTYLFTKSYRPVIDTLKALPDLKNLQQSSVLPWFVPSTRVYTGADNNVIISLPDAAKKKYTLKFFDENGTPLFEINKIIEPYLTLEKVNFSHSGIFNFELFDEGGALIEKDKIYIPHDAKTNGFLEQLSPFVR
ncbi:MAG: hypothetical protein ABJA71_17385 [Ginsengibacter sp.]